MLQSPTQSTHRVRRGRLSRSSWLCMGEEDKGPAAAMPSFVLSKCRHPTKIIPLTISSWEMIAIARAVVS
jgi:hypothetical protein